MDTIVKSPESSHVLHGASQSPGSCDSSSVCLTDEGQAGSHRLIRWSVNVRANTPLTDLIRSGFAAFTTIDGMPTVPASLRIGLGAKWKNSEGARQVPLPNGMTLAGT